MRCSSALLLVLVLGVDMLHYEFYLTSLASVSLVFLPSPSPNLVIPKNVGYTIASTIPNSLPIPSFPANPHSSPPLLLPYLKPPSLSLSHTQAQKIPIQPHSPSHHRIPPPQQPPTTFPPISSSLSTLPILTPPLTIPSKSLSTTHFLSHQPAYLPPQRTPYLILSDPTPSHIAPPVTRISPAIFPSEPRYFLVDMLGIPGLCW